MSSSRRFFDHDKDDGVSADNAELIELTERTLADAFAAGQLRSADLKSVQIAGRALVYGFARMNIDGHFPRWGVTEAEIARMAEAVLDIFIAGIARDLAYSESTIKNIIHAIVRELGARNRAHAVAMALRSQMI